MKNKKKFINLIMCLYLVFFGFKTIVFAETLDCTAWKDTLKDFQNLFDFCKILIPLLIIGLSMFDFIKAIVGKDDKDLKKAFNRLLKRLALAVVFFFLPMLINYFLEIIGTNSSVCVS